MLSAVPLDLLQGSPYLPVEAQLEDDRPHTGAAHMAGSQKPSTEEVRQGTLDLLILKTLSLDAQHGWGISQWIQQRSREVFLVNQGSLYPALHRLEHDGYIAAEWRSSENNRRAKYYRLTADGRKRLARDPESWERFTGAVQDTLVAT